MILGYFVSIVLTAGVSGSLAWYAWRQRAVPGARAYARLALAECLLALLEILSALSPAPDLALFWFRLRYTAGALIAVAWITFALEYSGRKDWLSRRFLMGLFIVPVLTQALLWSNAWHGLWVKQEVVFYRSGLLWIADIAARIPAPGFLAHMFYTLLLVLAGIGVIFLTAWMMRREGRAQALLLASAGLVAFIFALNSLFNFLPKTDFNVFIPGIGLSVLLIALAVFRFQFLKRAPETTLATDQTRLQAAERRTLAFFLLIFLLLISGFSTGAYLYYTGYERDFRAQVGAQLATITDLKVKGLQDWRVERLGDAEVLRRSPAFAALVRDYLHNPTATQAAEMLQAWLDSLRTAYGYERVFLLDTDGNERLASPPIPEPVAEHLIADSAAVLASGRVAFLDFHRNSAKGPIHLAVLAPVYAEGDMNRPLGVVVLRIDPHRTLYPYLQQWPAPSTTAETLLVRREGDTVLFLNELRFQQNTALTLRFPLAETEILAVKVALGQRGPVEGRDYRGHEVVGHLSAVPDSPWLLVTRMDKAEVYAPLREHLGQTLVVLGVLTLACGAGLVSVWRQQQMHYYRGRTAVLDALSESEEQYRLLAETTRDIILLHDMEGYITYVNQAGLLLGGFSEAAVSGKPITAFVPPDRLAEIAERRARRADGDDATFLYETEFMDNTGRRIPVEVNSTPVLREGKPAQFLIVARDISERKRAEQQIQFQANLVANISDAIIATDLEYHVMSWNTTAETIYGWTADEVLGQPLSKFLRTQFVDDTLEASIRAVTDKGFWKGEVLQSRKDGTTIPILASVALFRDHRGNPQGLVAVNRDISERKEAERKIRESEETYRNLFQNAQVGLFRTRISDGKILESNEQLAHMFGYDSRETFIAEYVTSQNYVDPGTRERMLRELQEHGEVRNFQARFYRKDRSIFWAEYSARIYPDKGWIEGVVEDITARKKAEAALRESEERYRQIIRVAGGVAYEFDWITDTFTFMERGIEPLVGYTLEEFTPAVFRQAITETENDTGGPDQAASRDLPYRRADLRLRRKDGSTVWVMDCAVRIRNAAGEIVRTIGMFQDITERKQAEAQILVHQAELQRLLTEAEQARLALMSVVEDQKRTEEALAVERTLLRTLVDHLPDSVYAKDAAGRKILANPTDVHNIGAASEADVLGKTDFELFPSELAERYHADDLYVLQTGQPILNREERITRPDGTLGWQLTSKVPLRDSAGKVVGLVGIAHDITERKQAAQELQNYAEKLQDLVAERTRALEEAQERLLNQTRLATLGQVAGSIAHELRTPLGAIKNAAYLINMLRQPSDETLEEAIAILNQEVANSDRIITSLLNFARPQRPHRQLLEVGPLVERMVQRLQPPPEVQVEVYVDGNLSPVIADATHLEQVFGNLLLNAIQAMPEGGRLTVRAEQCASLPDIAPPGFMPAHAANAGSGWIVVSVEDTGVGILPADLERIFEPLFTTKTTGIGLGLALVKSLVQANGGGIAVTSIPAERTTFDIYLPIAGISYESP